MRIIDSHYAGRSGVTRGGIARSLLCGAALLAMAPAAHAATFFFSSGNYIPGTTSPNPLTAPDTLAIVSGANKFFSMVSFANQSGTVDWQAGTIFLSNGATVANQSLWTTSADGTIANNGGTPSLFSNTGTFRKTGGLGSTTLSNASFNSGTIDAQTGQIVFNSGQASFAAGSVFTGAGSVVVSQNASFAGGFSSGNLAFAGGTYTGTGAALNGTADWRSGIFAGDWAVTAGSTLTALTGSNKFIAGAAFTNDGTVAWEAGSLFLSNASQLVNNGLFAYATSSSLSSNGGAVSTITNAADGVFRAAAGATVSVGNRFVNDGGTLDADGVFAFNGGNAIFNDGSVFTGTGTTAINSSAAFNGGLSSTNLDFNNGTFAGTAAILSGTADWNGGGFDGGWTVAAGSTLTALTGSNKFLNAATFVNDGTIAWQGGSLFLSNASQFTNEGLVEYSTSASIAPNGGAVSTVTNGADGTFRVAGGATVNVSNRFVNDGGTLDVDGVMAFNGANAVFNDGSVFTGTGSVAINSSAAFNGDFSSTNVDFNGGTYTGTAATLSGTADWNGGSFDGGWTVAAGSTLTALTGSNKFLNAATFVNDGTIAWQGGSLFLSNASQFTNNGLVEYSTSASIVPNGGAVSTVTNGADGTFRVAGGTTVSVGNRFVNDGGTLDADGVMAFNGANAVFNDGSVFTGTGSVAINSSAAFNGGFSSTNVDFNGGTYTGTAAVLNGTADWAGGTFSGGWGVASAATLNVVGGANKLIDAGTVTNDGTMVWQAGSLFLSNASRLVNEGRIDVQGDNGIFANGGAASGFVNDGLLQKTAGTGTTTIGNGIGFVNTGTIDVRSGTIALPTNFANDGTLTGTGVFAVSGTLTNNGIVAPGTGAGQLSLSGDYVQTAIGTLAIQFASSSLADLFSVSGAGQLGGTLALSCISTCGLATGDVFTIFDSNGALSGVFANITTSGFRSGFNYAVNYDYDLDRVQLTVLNAGTIGGAVPEPATWAMIILGFGLVGTRLRRRAAVRPIDRLA